MTTAAPSFCPLCRGLIALHGTGDPGDPVVFPRHGGGVCLDHDTPAAIVLDAIRATGAQTVTELATDPAKAAVALATIRRAHR